MIVCPVNTRKSPNRTCCDKLGVWGMRRQAEEAAPSASKYNCLHSSLIHIIYRRRLFNGQTSKTCSQTPQLTQRRPQRGSMEPLCVNGPLYPRLLSVGLPLPASMLAQSATGNISVKNTSNAIYSRCIVARTQSLICAITVVNDFLDGKSLVEYFVWILSPADPRFKRCLASSPSIVYDLQSCQIESRGGAPERESFASN